METSENTNYEEINLKNLIEVLWTSKRFIFITISLSFLVFLLYSLSLEDEYRSEALLVPIEESGKNLSSINSQLGGLASLSGINVSSSSNVNRIDEALRIIKTRSFFLEFIKDHSVLPLLMAVENWDKEKNKINFDSSIYNNTAQEWNKDFEFSLQRAHKEYLKKLKIYQDKDQGFHCSWIRAQITSYLSEYS